MNEKADDVSDYLIWSNEHRAWWRPNSRGYTIHLASAGRYTREEAVKNSRVRDQVPGEIMPEIPVREDDVLASVVGLTPGDIVEIEVPARSSTSKDGLRYRGRLVG